jgi:hypothetical protein
MRGIPVSNLHYMYREGKYYLYSVILVSKDNKLPEIFHPK